MASNLVPDFEVKVLLKPSEVLGSDNKLKGAVLSAFSMQSSTKKMNVQFVDTKDRDMYAGGWNLRIRKAEGEDEFELTYKKRYMIEPGILNTDQGNIETAVTTARQEGFDSASTYEAQVEVGYQKQTLSISHDAKVPDTGFEGTDLPLAEDSRKFLADNAPDNFKNWSASNWGVGHLTNSIVYGPVLAKRYKGTWNGSKLFIEVWPIRKNRIDASIESIVEASFKTPDLNKALEGRTKLVDLVQNAGWFVAEDSLKTKLVMERYGETAWHS